MEAQRWEEEASQTGEPLMVREDVGGMHERRRKIDGPSWNGLAQSKPKLVGACCMELHVDIKGGEMVRVESL